ncbi:MAG: DUF4391 domain-containing protein [Clostridium sp.]|nr:DUF4391 domain-containing protein [Clostridium sp.]
MGPTMRRGIECNVKTRLLQSSNYQGEPMQIIDNINHIVKNDLQDSIQPGSKLSIAAACFSIYAYQELKKQLEKQISVLENKMKKEKQLNRQMEMNAELKRLRKSLEVL